MPVHSVELRHLVLLNVNVEDTGASFLLDNESTRLYDVLGFKPSDFAIINTDGSSDFDIENQLTLRDAKDRKLDLRLNYMLVL